MPRLFVGIGVPEILRNSLSLSRGGLPGARYVDPSDYHVTLRFIGDVDNAEADRLAEALEGVQAEPFEARIDSYDSFGGDKPRLVYLGVKPDQGLVALQQQVEFACRHAGFDAEGRKFVPHITVARLRKEKAAEVARWLMDRHMPPVASFPVTRFSLYIARPGGGGPYHPLIDYPLG